jgi:hypothetical protein
MNHPAELALHKYMDDATKGKSTMSEDTAKQIAEDVRQAVLRQFGGTGKREFRLRMSNLGRPTCQLWFDKNKPETALPRPTTFVMNMMLGDIVEAVFKGLLTEAGVEYGDSESVSLDIGEHTVSGTYDLTLDGAVDDVKSASDWSYRNKFESFETLRNGDAFGYVAQLVGYAKATGLKPGGWWVVNKANGSFKYVPATGIDEEAEMQKINSTIDTVNTNEFSRCFEPVEETFRGKATGNKMLCKECSFCDYRKACWPNLKELPAVKSQAKQPKMVSYIELAPEYNEASFFSGRAF